MSKATVITAIENAVKDTKKSGKKVVKNADTTKDIQVVKNADTTKENKRGYTNFTSNKLPVKVVTSETLPDYSYSYKGQTAENKAIETYSFTVGEKTYYLTSNFDGCYYGYNLPELYKRATATEGATVKATAKGGKEATAAGYTEGENIELQKVSVFSKRLLVYVKTLYIEIGNDVYIYIVRNAKGVNIHYTSEKGFYIA